ncbi:MAG: hypothetical protein CM1200mP30_22900 [Pseudomonadota bacterium]|nr:MAG: hypothetical protein CM1200mP30_22900 [Pseudomonadota bacterium]
MKNLNLMKKGVRDEDDGDNDVVFGDGQIDSKSISRFVKSFPDSAIKNLCSEKKFWGTKFTC